MPQRHVTIASSVGLHARPAGLFAKAAAATGVPVTIAREGGNPVDASSVLLVMSIGLRHGETAELASEAEGADAALDSLVALLSTDLDAPAPATEPVSKA